MKILELKKEFNEVMGNIDWTLKVEIDGIVYCSSRSYYLGYMISREQVIWELTNGIGKVVANNIREKLG